MQQQQPAHGAKDLNGSPDTPHSSTAVNHNNQAAASHALVRVKTKLQGIEQGMTLNILGQVNYLINIARDPANLSQMYAGWKPWL